MNTLRLKQGGRIDRCLLAVQGKGENEHDGRPKKERPNGGERISRYQQGSVHDFERGEEDDAKINRRADPACDALVSQNDERGEIAREKKRTALYFAPLIALRTFTKQDVSVINSIVGRA